MPDAYAYTDARSKLAESLASTRLGQAWAERRVTIEQSRRLVMRLVRSARRDFRGVTSSFVARSISPSRWYRVMARGIAAVHAAAGLIAAGTARPVEAIRTAIDANVRRQLGFLNRWYNQLKATVAPLDGRAVNRAGLYANSAWGSAQSIWRVKATATGYHWERRRLGYVEKHCFPAGTLVETECGLRPIEAICVGDKVLTRKGYRRVLRTFRNPYSSDLVRVESGQNSLACTPNHPFLTSQGWVRADELALDDEAVLLQDVPDDVRAHVALPNPGDRVTAPGKVGFPGRIAFSLGKLSAIERFDPLPEMAANGAGVPSPAMPSHERPLYRNQIDVFNIEVEDQHEYVANGFLVHNCPDCLDYAAMGWQPIGTLPQIGDSLCGGNCDCRFEYMMDETAGPSPVAPMPIAPTPPIAPTEPPVPTRPGIFRQATSAIGGFVGRFLKQSRSTLFSPAVRSQVATPAPTVVATVGPTIRNPQAIRGYLDQQLNRLAASRAATDPAEQEFAAKYGKALDAYAKNAANTPGLVPPGPILERIEVYLKAYGSEKLDAISASFGKVETTLRASIEQMESRKKAIVADLVGGRSMSATERAALQAEAKSLALSIGEVANSQRPAIRQAIVDILRVENPSRIRTEEIADKRPNESAASQHARAKRFLSPILHDNSESANTIKLGQISKQGQQRAYYDDKNNVIMVSATDMAATHIHELGHWIDEQVKLGGQKVLARSIEFLKARTAGEAAVSINKYTKSRAYMSDEVGKPDKFDKIFGDGAAYVGKDYAGTGTEIVSMGVEILHNAAEHFVKDREFAGFILGILDGRLR